MYSPRYGQRVIVNRVKRGIVTGFGQLRGQDVVYVLWDALTDTGQEWRDTVPADRITGVGEVAGTS